MHKKFLAVVMGVSIACLDGIGLGNAGELSMILGMMTTEPAVLALEEIAEDYADETGMEIEIMPLGSDTEAVLKTRMAANDLPDLWSTHGWSYIRYREYLEPLQDQPWAKDVSPLILPAIAGKQGDFYVLPMDVDVTGIPCNIEVLEKSGVDIDSIKTWDDLAAACEKIKSAGFTPMAVGGKEIHPIGYFFLWTGVSFLAADPEAKADLDALVNGTFPLERWRKNLNLLLDFQKKGYFNKNVVTASRNEATTELARGNAAFVMMASNQVVMEALTYNPNAKLGIIRIPAARPDLEMSLMTGERAAIGVWKDSPQKAEAIAFLQYLAKPENIYKVASAGGNAEGLTVTTSDTGILKPFHAKYANTKTYPVFDRVYLPSGMWSTLGTVGAAVLAGNMSVDQALAKTESEFNRLYKQYHQK